MAVISSRRFLQVLLPLAAVSAVTAVLNIADASLTTAALCFVPVVVGSALLGSSASVVSVVAAFLATNYFFTPPRESLRIDKTDDLVALVAFAIAAAVVSATVARVNLLRHRAIAVSREARTRLELTQRLTAGEDPASVVASARSSMESLFGLDECQASLDARGNLHVSTVPAANLLPSNQRTQLEAFVNGLTAALDRVRLDREARQARESAEIEQARAGFLAAMTHNLRTPLASIGAAASVLLDPGQGLDRAQTVELLETVRGEADRLDRLVTKVLLLGRIQAGTLAPTPKPVDVDEIVEAAARRVRRLGLRRIHVLWGDDLPPVLVDRELVEVAIVNVLENSLRYSSAESTVEVRMTQVRDEVRLSVIDHGPGIPPEEREQMFERFVRGPRTKDSSGAGIGLAITREFVEAHGGKCWFEETRGGGATLVMALPIASVTP